jgi:PmbA protein
MDSTQSALDHAAALVDAARRAGAEAADAVVMRSASTSVSVRDGKVEGTEASDNDDMSLRVFVGRRVASVSASLHGDRQALAERAVAMAKASPEDPFAGLAEPALLASDIADLDLYDATTLTARQMTEQALALEEACLAVSGVTKSGSAGVSAGAGGLVLVTSHGFSGAYRSSRFSRSVSAIAGTGTGMERDYDYSSKLFFADLADGSEIGRSAGERAVRRLKPRKAKTGPVNVVFDPRVARGIVGHMMGAMNGASVARGTSLFRSKMNTAVASAHVTITDNPQKHRGQSSRPFDSEGVRGEAMTMIEAGVLKNWLLASPQARELGLQTNGRGARGGSSVSPSSTNAVLQPGEKSPDELMRDIGTGFYVTEVFGQGVNMITGEYSRGASGFWIENGTVSYPVSEVTIASNLLDMFNRIIPANDIDYDHGTAAPTLLIEGMTLAGS